MSKIIIDKNLQEQIEKITALVQMIDDLEAKANSLCFITIKQFAEMTGWSEPTVQNLFNRKDFPSCNYGKTKIAEISAVKAYFSVPRRK